MDVVDPSALIALHGMHEQYLMSRRRLGFHGGSRARTQRGGEGRLGIRRGFVQDVALSRGCREDAIIT